MMPFYANINRLVEDWVIAFGERYSHRLNPLLSFSMNLELVSAAEFHLVFVGNLACRY